MGTETQRCLVEHEGELERVHLFRVPVQDIRACVRIERVPENGCPVSGQEGQVNNIHWVHESVLVDGALPQA